MKWRRGKGRRAGLEIFVALWARREKNNLKKGYFVGVGGGKTDHQAQWQLKPD